MKKMEEYKQNIIKMVNSINDFDLLEYLNEYIKLTIEAEE